MESNGSNQFLISINWWAQFIHNMQIYMYSISIVPPSAAYFMSIPFSCRPTATPVMRSPKREKKISKIRIKITQQNNNNSNPVIKKEHERERERKNIELSRQNKKTHINVITEFIFVVRSFSNFDRWHRNMHNSGSSSGSSSRRIDTAHSKIAIETYTSIIIILIEEEKYKPNWCAQTRMYCYWLAVCWFNCLQSVKLKKNIPFNVCHLLQLTDIPIYIYIHFDNWMPRRYFRIFFPQKSTSRTCHSIEQIPRIASLA